jgi:enamine deaminase RidA (YjgF/YER057c/UK114 family)
MEIVQEHGTTVCQSNGYIHLWRMGMQHPEGDSAVQTTVLLDGYEESLSQFGANVADNCIRTWFFVRDVDTHYAGLVQARKEWFTRHGLTENTHYIASTGIGGGPADTKALVQLGAYALQGFESAQVRYLHAPQWLNATHEYGVTFERGTAVEYGDRAHVIISGTASIDHLGQVVYPGDIVGQTKRMWANVEALLGEASASMDDMMHIIVYLRDMADYEVVRSLFAERFPQIPTVITLAPVCRPAWLIEMECVAVVPRKNASFRNF